MKHKLHDSLSGFIFISNSFIMRLSIFALLRIIMFGALIIVVCSCSKQKQNDFISVTLEEKVLSDAMPLKVDTTTCPGSKTAWATTSPWAIRSDWGSWNNGPRYRLLAFVLCPDGKYCPALLGDEPRRGGRGGTSTQP